MFFYNFPVMHPGCRTKSFLSSESERIIFCGLRVESIFPEGVQPRTGMDTQARKDLPDIPEPRMAAEKQIEYFVTNSLRMTYGTFRAQGLFIGSGVVEAGCKTVVGKRLKNSGMFWSVKGAQNVLDLRTALLNNRFEDLWLARNKKAA